MDNEFTTAAFRFGHSFLAGDIKSINNRGTKSTFTLTDLFASPELINSPFITNIMRGASRSFTKKRSFSVIDDIRNFLTFTQDGAIKTDLFSLNVQRGRDHGLPSYARMRQALNLPPVGFNYFPMSDVLRKDGNGNGLYENPNEMDLWVGILGEPNAGKSLLGEVGSEIVARNFLKVRDGDRFWFERRPNDQSDTVYPCSVVR